MNEPYALAKTWYPQVSKETIEDFLFSQCKEDISAEQKALFIWIALANNLNPFKREIYPIPFWNTKLGKTDLQPVTAYTVYLQKAQQTGKLNGWNIQIFEDDHKKVTGGKITIYRKDRDNPFEREVSWNEIVQTKKDGTINKNWNDKPEFMTKKTLIAQGMRLCFPEDMWGMPYVDAEILETETTATQEVVPSLELENKKPNEAVIVNTHQAFNSLRVLSIKDSYSRKPYLKKELSPTAK